MTSGSGSTPTTDEHGEQRPERERRGRLLFVGALPPGREIRDRLRQTPAHARNLFEAIGEVTTSDSRHPIFAVVIDSNALPSSGARAVDALRRIDPSLRIIGVVDGQLPEGARDGFDDVLDAPLDFESLRTLIGPEWITPAPAVTPAAVPTMPAAPPPAPASTPASSPASPETPPATPPTVARPAARRPAADERPRQPEPTTRQVTTAANQLGDTNLLDAVLDDPDGVSATAVELVRQQTGWSDVHLLPADTPDPPDSASRVVAIEGRPGPRLVTTHATSAELAPWADWLGRWLTLDASYRDYRLMAMQDDLTKTWNRRYYERFLEEKIEEARQRRRPVTVMVFDIDDFKHYNDEYGHEAGDVILCETVGLLHSVIRANDRVCRVGGDEFAVIFADLDEPRESGSRHPSSVEAIVRRFQAQVSAMRFPKLGLEAPGTLSISAGLATFPWDGSDPASLLRHADHRMLESKRKGKDQITFGPTAANIRRGEAGKPEPDSRRTED